MLTHYATNGRYNVKYWYVYAGALGGNLAWSVYLNNTIFLSLCVLWLIIFVLWIIAVNKNQGNFVYILDDAYIHMSVAKNFVEHGVFGVTRYEFSSSSSSLLWTGLLIICFSLFGVKEMIPFLLNILFASILMLVLYNFLKKQKILSNRILYLLIVQSCLYHCL